MPCDYQRLPLRDIPPHPLTVAILVSRRSTIIVMSASSIVRGGAKTTKFVPMRASNPCSHDDDTLRRTLIARGQERARLFTWRQTAERTLATLYQVGASHRSSSSLRRA